MSEVKLVNKVLIWADFQGQVSDHHLSIKSSAIQKRYNKYCSPKKQRMAE